MNHPAGPVLQGFAAPPVSLAVRPQRAPCGPVDAPRSCQKGIGRPPWRTGWAAIPTAPGRAALTASRGLPPGIRSGPRSPATRELLLPASGEPDHQDHSHAHGNGGLAL